VPVGAGDVSVLFEADHTLVILSGVVGSGIREDLVDAAVDVVQRGAPAVLDDARVTSIDHVGRWFVDLVRGVRTVPEWQQAAEWQQATEAGTPRTLSVVREAGPGRLD